MSKCVLVVATMSSADIIGINGSMPWHHPLDLRLFKKRTTPHKNLEKNVVVMGNRTYQSLGVPALPNRYHIVLTRNDRITPKLGYADRVRYVHSTDEALQVIQRLNPTSYFVIGGEQIYKEFEPHAEECYKSRIPNVYLNDVPEKYSPKSTNYFNLFWPDWELVKKIEYYKPESLVIEKWKRIRN